MLAKLPTEDDDIRLVLGDVSAAVRRATNGQQRPWTNYNLSGKVTLKAAAAAYTPPAPSALQAPAAARAAIAGSAAAAPAAGSDSPGKLPRCPAADAVRRRWQAAPAGQAVPARRGRGSMVRGTR